MRSILFLALREELELSCLFRKGCYYNFILINGITSVYKDNASANGILPLGNRRYPSGQHGCVRVQGLYLELSRGIMGAIY